MDPWNRGAQVDGFGKERQRRAKSTRTIVRRTAHDPRTIGKGPPRGRPLCRMFRLWEVLVADPGDPRTIARPSAQPRKQLAFPEGCTKRAEVPPTV